MIDLRKGIRRAGPVTTLGVAGVANAAVIFQVSNFAQQIGTKTVRLKKILARPAAGAGDQLFIGTGAGGTFVSLIPAVNLVGGMDNGWQEIELPEAESSADITAYGAAVANNIVQLEVEEVG